MAAEASPVNAPIDSAHTDCEPSLTIESFSNRPTSQRYTLGGQTAMSTVVCAGNPSNKPSISSALSAREPCIFQFPAINGRRIGSTSTVVQAAPAKGAAA
jgi:hypothetical protein